MAAAAPNVEVEPELEASAVGQPQFAFLIYFRSLVSLDSMAKSRILPTILKCTLSNFYINPVVTFSITE